MSDSNVKKSSFVPAWALAMLIPWLGLAIFQNVNKNPEFTIASISGTLIAVLLLGVGIPFLVYIITKKSQKAAIVTMAIVGGLGLVSQGVLAARQSGTIGGSSSMPAASPVLMSFLNSALSGNEPGNGHKLMLKLDEKIAEAERAYEGEELIQIRAFHAGMRTTWLSQCRMQEAIRDFSIGDVVALVSAGKAELTPAEKSKVQFSGLGDIAAEAQRTLDSTHKERERMVKSLTKDGMGQEPAAKLAEKMLKETEATVRHRVAETSAELWYIYAELGKAYHLLGYQIRDDNNQQVSREQRLADLQQRLTVAKSEYEKAIAELDRVTGK